MLIEIHMAIARCAITAANVQVHTVVLDWRCHHSLAVQVGHRRRRQRLPGVCGHIVLVKLPRGGREEQKCTAHRIYSESTHRARTIVEGSWWPVQQRYLAGTGKLIK